jgi:hypothetical protein
MVASATATFFCGATYFLHFLALGFSSFPLQTHLRSVLSPSLASLVTSITPIASCSTYFMFKYAEKRGWTGSPRWMLFWASIVLACFQFMLGWRMHASANGGYILGPVIDLAACLLLMGCVQTGIMTLLNHIGVSTMGDYAYTARASGSAGYMVAVMLMGAIGSSNAQIANWHLFVGSSLCLVHSVFAFAGWYLLRKYDKATGLAKPRENRLAGDSRPPASDHDRWQWRELILLVWLVAICEMSYGLFAHEFLTLMYDSSGYFVFATAVAIEIAMLLIIPFFPRLKAKLLFVGPLGWMCLFAGCLIATQGFAPMGVFALGLALNCPFQISTNEHAHKMNPSVMGVASMTLAQSIGYMTATLLSVGISRIQPGPVGQWIVVLPISILAFVLAVRKLTRKDSAFDVNDLGKPSGVSRLGSIPSTKERANNLESGLGTDDPSADAQDIHVIVLDALSSGVGVVTEARPNPRKLVGSNADAHS